MAITKTKFLHLTRCPKIVSLEKDLVSSLNKEISKEEYQEEERTLQVKELLENVVGESEITKRHLDAMLPYYKQVEIESGKLVASFFGGKTIYAESTLEQVPFTCEIEGHTFLCYVDIYNENEEINIIEVKATTSKKYLALAGGYRGKKKYSLFHKANDIYYLKDEIPGYNILKEMPMDLYNTLKEKLYDRFGIGAYIYDLALQRFIIEHSNKLNKKVHYYLAVLNTNYVYDGTKEHSVNVYNKDQNGENLISLFALDNVTLKLQEKIAYDAKVLIKSLNNPNNESLLGPWCNYKSPTICPFFKSVCGAHIKEKNSVLSYMNNASGFKMPDGTRLKGLELINNGFNDMLDIDGSLITNPNHIIERNSYITKEPYINFKKIKCIMDSLEYPIYHLDFETFPCPIPRFKGESPYTQSPFEFSLHIEREPGKCDAIKDNYIFLAHTIEDERRELVKELLKHIDSKKGTILAQNVSFEKNRILELAKIFPEYKEDLIAISKRTFDLLWILNNNKEFFTKHNFSSYDINTVNFYDYRLSGSYSIKKTLPLFSNLSYDNLGVHNGTEAIIEYANYNNMNEEELAKTRENLKIYCRQDTWAMVEILNSIRKIIDEL